ncbi:family 43 glycosylhydrolase [Streptococcus moroccensis]|uniref:Xylan 1,4-beta-xylosidase n=1 Tax=Streptococcus moroccensis TaxID=1451356 RepID=A0ABT9YUC0_9STRE|nr:family 43 glycosylhydrolase [Streptococcus moroccensis]MDQ0223192.1 hypothetical protein [Streptococcus moroccensis]
MTQIVNPYLPLTEYVPDGEPHVFDGRLYIYGSHDRANGTSYCQDHYVTWSAPVDDLTNWRYEGQIYRRNQDPSNLMDDKQLWAPDVTKGPDGRYYLYYCLSFYPEIGVAVSESPVGPFEFLGHVKYPKELKNGLTLREFMPFDPAIYTDDDGQVYLYYGFCPGGEKEMALPDFTEEELSQMTPEMREKIETIKSITFGENSMVARLEPDMVTLKEIPRPLIPGAKFESGTSFEGHAFFEASSIRKINGTYYFVYSSYKSHELCYATSQFPDKDFVFGGTLISNGDIGFQGREKPVNTLGNNHGSLIEVNDKLYVFYHRQTNGTEFSRQGCAEEVTLLEDGSIEQVEITSCGLNGGPLVAKGTFPAAIACHITSPFTMNRIDYDSPLMKKQTKIVEPVHGTVYIDTIQDDTVIGYKYFNLQNPKQILLELKGTFSGEISVTLDCDQKEMISRESVTIDTEQWELITIPFHYSNPKSSLYFKFSGEGSCSMKTIGFLS